MENRLRRRALYAWPAVARPSPASDTIDSMVGERSSSRVGRILPGLTLLLAGLAGAGVLLAGPGYRFGGWGLGPAFTLLRWGAQLGAVAAVC